MLSNLIEQLSDSLFTSACCSSPKGSQAQLKEVWEELDGLDPNRFNPKTFFILHGKVGRVFQTQADVTGSDGSYPS